MKKYFIGIIATILAFSGFAFKEASRAATRPTVDMYIFEFRPTQPYTAANVQNTSNVYWQYKGKNLSLCSNVDQKACRVAVTADFVDNPAAPTQLDGVSIGATQSGSTAHVTAISDPSLGNTYSNQAD